MHKAASSPSSVNPAARLAITVDEAAELAAVSVSTIRRAISDGELKAAKLGTSVRVRPIDLDRWLQVAAASDERAIVPGVLEGVSP